MGISKGKDIGSRRCERMWRIQEEREMKRRQGVSKM
jgi:hypothetical protein